jgi:hypothetical protein
MAKTMTPETAALLRAPFKPEEIGKLPRITCPQCRDSQSRNCVKHDKIKCESCHNWITTAHTHLDYVGHAEATDRFLQADPEWAWEPVAFDADGLPKFDPVGGLWIKLTIAGITRLGYGHADGKKGPDAIKVTIGDALRNAGLRFGVAIDLWGATFDGDDGLTTAPTAPPPASVTMIQDIQRSTIFALWRDLGYDGEDKREERLAITSKLLGGIPLESTSDLTAAEADALIKHLRERLAQIKRAADKEAQQ